MQPLELFQDYNNDDYLPRQLTDLVKEIKMQYINQDISMFTYEMFESFVNENTAKYAISIDLNSIEVVEQRMNQRNIMNGNFFDQRVYKYPMQGKIEMFRMCTSAIAVKSDHDARHESGILYISISTHHNTDKIEVEKNVLQKLKCFHEFVSINMQIINNNTSKLINNLKSQYEDIKQDILFEQHLVHRIKALDM